MIKVRATSIKNLIDEARDLRSESGENPEYDRALVELVTRACGISHDEGHDEIEGIVLRDDPIHPSLIETP